MKHEQGQPEKHDYSSPPLHKQGLPCLLGPGSKNFDNNKCECRLQGRGKGSKVQAKASQICLANAPVSPQKMLLESALTSLRIILVQYVLKKPIWDYLVANFVSLLKDTENSAKNTGSKAIRKSFIPKLMAMVNSRFHCKTHSFHMP